MKDEKKRNFFERGQFFDSAHAILHNLASQQEIELLTVS